MALLTVPKGIDDLTAEWLTAALADASDGATVAEVIAIRVGHGDVADAVRLIPLWDRPETRLASVVAKVPASGPGGVVATRTYELEAAFYTELAPTLWVNRPTCYLARCEPDNQGYVVVMEDLSPAEPGDQLEGCSPEDAAPVMSELAALHAPRWGDPFLLDIDWLDRPEPESVRATAELLPLLFAGFVDRYRDRVDREVLTLSERLMSQLERYLLHRPGPWTVIHGDFRLDNLLFGAPRVGVVDWETVKIGPGLSDVAYFIGSALWPADRRRSEERLVRSYHACLAEMGVSLRWDECWAAYRRYSFDGLLMAIGASMLETRTVHSDDMFVAMVNRHGRQALDLDATEFLVD